MAEGYSLLKPARVLEQAQRSNIMAGDFIPLKQLNLTYGIAIMYRSAPAWKRYAVVLDKSPLRPFSNGGRLAPCGGGWPLTADRGRFHDCPGIFHRKLSLSSSFYPGLSVKPPFFPATLSPNGKKPPLLPPATLPTGRPPPQPSLDGIAETVCITPFALYYAP
jgi:hypothetical protein